MNLYLDGKPLELPESLDCENFEDFCQICSKRLHIEDRAIHSIHLDGKEVDCTTLPSDHSFLNAQKIEIMSCLLKDLVLTVLQAQEKSAQDLAGKVMELSTNCLIESPRETFDCWKNILEILKSLVGFIPKFLAIQPLLSDAEIELTETDLTNRIQEIQEFVDTCRKALDSQDIVQFSDVLELRIVPWLKSHADLSQKLSETTQRLRAHSEVK